jgi:hypothetical protein
MRFPVPSVKRVAKLRRLGWCQVNPEDTNLATTVSIRTARLCQLQLPLFKRHSRTLGQPMVDAPPTGAAD